MSFPLLQVPKTKNFFAGLTARPGCSLIYADAASLEPHCCAYYSRDKRLLQLYGPGAKPNCIYIFYGSATPQYGEKFAALGYNADDPTKEAVKAVKQQLADDRQVCKKVVLGCIAEGTLVRVKDKGHIPIEEVTDSMLVWDGIEWVSTSGAIFKGEKECINFNGHWMTYDHRVKTKNGWDMAERADSTECVRPDHTSYSWSDVWQLVCGIFSGYKRGRIQKSIR